MATCPHCDSTVPRWALRCEHCGKRVRSILTFALFAWVASIAALALLATTATVLRVVTGLFVE